MITRQASHFGENAERPPLAEAEAAVSGTIQPGGLSPQLVTGTIKAFLTETDASVEIAGGARIHALQAASCLLAPVIGDKVLVCHDNGEAFILAVLSRAGTMAAEISVPQAETLVIKARREVSLEAPVMRMTAKHFSLLADVIFQAGNVLTRNFKRIAETVGDKLTHARTITSQSEVRTAIVADVDTLRAKSLVQTIEAVSTQTSEIALLTARRDVRIDGERVSVG